MTTFKKIAFRAILILFPLLILLILELSLRLFGYGKENSKLFFIPEYVPEVYHENVGGYNKYVAGQLQVHADKIENHIRNVMEVEKGPRTLRGFALGESAVQGFPYRSNHSFTKMIEVALMRSGRYDKVEIMNMGVSAISSYAVRDVAKKVMAYEPDFVILYGGNNEYYGTFSQGTGGTHFTRNLYMQLSELRLSMLVKDFISLFVSKPEKTNVNMMKELFRQNHMPKNTETDQLVAANFVSNMEAIIDRYAEKEIPVLVVEPVCNLLDMAPFGGENDKEIAHYLRKIDQVIERKNFQLADSAIGILREDHPGNANLLFLQARLDHAINGKADLEKYIAAKDQDMIPFRPRSELVSALEGLGRSKMEKYGKVHYVPLRQKLTTLYGDTILGNDMFIDHVHFNLYGHQLVAEILTAELGAILDFSPGEQDAIQALFADGNTVEQAVFALPVYQFNANREMKNLIDQPPFSDMVFPYGFDRGEINHAVSDMGMGMVGQLVAMDRVDAVNALVMHYLNNNEFEKVHQHLLADRFLFPGSYYRYLNLGRFLQMFEQYHPDAEAAYTQAYLLSEKQPYIYDEIMRFYRETNQGERARTFREKYGKP